MKRLPHVEAAGALKSRLDASFSGLATHSCSRFDTVRPCPSPVALRTAMVFSGHLPKAVRWLPVIYDPVQTEIQRAEIFAPLDDFHHGFVIQFSNVTEV